ncbi:MAG TPA: alpha/beta hydrolase [Leptolyngbyaceae cyanobacterium]
MPLDPQVQVLLEQIAQLEWPSVDTLNPVQAREQFAKFRGKPLKRPKIGSVENRTIPSQGGEIPIRIYLPEGVAPFPVLVFFHGGGWVLGDLDAVDSCCRSWCKDAGCVVVSVDYRLAPEHKFPAPVEDAYAATLWVVNNASSINGDANQIAVAGDSAGGNLAAAVTLMARDRGTPALIYQVLIYPVTQYGFDTESYREYAEGYGLKKAEMVWFWHHYLAKPEDGKNPYASPLFAESLANLPPAMIMTAECDVLRDDAILYAEKLQSAGVTVQLKQYDGMIHGFLGMAPVLDGGKNAIADVAAQLRLIFH